MKDRKITAALLAGCVLLLLAGCGSKSKELYEQASADLEKGHYEDAISSYEEVISGEEYLPEAYRGQGIAYYETGEYVKASEAFANALKQEDTGKAFQRDVLLYQAASCYKEGMYDNAWNACQKALELKEDAAGLLMNGKIALARDDYEGASQSFDAAYEEESTFDMALWIYQAYLDRDMEADGTTYLERVLENKPRNAEDYCSRGKAYYYMQDYENAKAELLEAVDEGSEEGKLLLGKVYLAMKDTANARMMYQSYVDVESKAAQGYNGLALCSISDGDYDAALDYVQKGLRAAQTEEVQELMYNEAVIYEKKLDFHTAYQKFAEYLKLYPNDEAAVKEHQFLKSRTGTLAAETEQESVETGEDLNPQEAVPDSSDMELLGEAEGLDDESGE
ncbi:MAG: tetratricopeptide repeat protein [Blautia sp.]|jgi:tetratricopeptide (TPR) repeat protein